jgi:acyl-coenzyme A thioesterase PaaI-like protein
MGDRIDEFQIPPPVFEYMQGQFVSYDPDKGELITQFPVVESYLNPYSTMQGGMIAAAVDNTFGPLSVLVASPNITRHFEMTYSKPVTMEMGYIRVHAQFIRREGRRLFFRADVRDPNGTRLARAKSIHWILK